MNKIHALTPEVIAKIAAGQVIERPSNAVKELIENAIDANAHAIDIHIKESGFREITVIDDGVGMSETDLALSVLPHTTSKVKNVDDLLHIASLGFRGEALASLASVSDIEISSREEKNTLGNTITVENGNTTTNEKQGMQKGTRVSIRNLFAPMPGRKKFLKSGPTEFRHIADVVCGFALSYPNILFRLFHNENEFLNFSDVLDSRMNEVFSESISLKLMKSTFTSSLLSFDAYLTHPEASLPTSQKLYQFVNGRRIHSDIITAAIKEAYGRLLDPHSFPVGMIAITIPHQFVDVNVHPTKREVHFEGAELVFQDIKEGVQEMLTKYNLTYGLNPNATSSKRDIAQSIKAEVATLPISHIKTPAVADQLLIIDNTYLVTPHETGVVLYDQHAAHEALLYDAFVASFRRHASHIKTITPIQMELTKTELSILHEQSEVISKMGFEIEPFGGSTVRITAIPLLVNEMDIEGHLREILSYLNTAKYPDIDRINNKMLSYLACKSAIKAGDKLTKGEALKIIDALSESSATYTCPHGRPVKIVINTRELGKMFKRH